MKYEEYEAIAEGLTSENALEKMTEIMAKLKTDCIENEATIASMTEEQEEAKKKYQDLQVDYIKKFIGKSGSSEEEEGEEDDMAAKLAEMTSIIAENMNS